MTHQRIDYGLTRRESEVAQLLLYGWSNKAIARTLYISLRTVKGHIGMIMLKTHAQSRTEAAVRLARAAGPVAGLSTSGAQVKSPTSLR